MVSSAISQNQYYTSPRRFSLRYAINIILDDFSLDMFTGTVFDRILDNMI